MADTVPILVEAAFSAVAAAIFGAIGAVILRRKTDPSARRANHLFAVWWIALGLFYLVVALFNAAQLFATPSFAVTLLALYLVITLLMAALWGLCYYLLYLYTGRESLFTLVTVAYALLAAVFFVAIAWRNPIAVDATTSPAQLTYERDYPPGVSLALGLLVSVPVLLAAIGYGSLYFKVRDPLQRFRVALVSLAFVGWFGWSFVGTLVGAATDLNETLGWRIASRAIGLVAPLVILLAFVPPAWVRRRLEATQASPPAPDLKATP